METNKKDLLEDEFLTIPEISKRYPAFTEGSLRWLRFHGEENGFNKCVRKIGKKCLICLREFRLWIDTQKG